jgi:hypothetical protein
MDWQRFNPQARPSQQPRAPSQVSVGTRWSRFSNPAAAIVAYWEKESVAGPGTLRKEYRVRLVKDFSADELNAAWGSDWRKYKPFATHVLEERYIRRGQEEPWKPHSSANSREQAMEYIDSNAIALDPTLQKLEAAQAQYRQEQKVKEEAAHKSKAEAQERASRRDRSEAAFNRLRDSKDGIWATRYNEYVLAHMNDPAFQASARDNPEFMKYYQAVMSAETVPAKKKAIREFLTKFGGG